MSKLTQLSILFLTVVLMLTATGIALAQDAPAPTVSADQEIELDETVTAEDLGVEEPTLLPDSKFYFLKNWSRSIKSFFTFNKVEKAELKLKYATERLLEVRKLVENNKEQEIIEKAAEKYKEEIEKIKEAADNIKEKAEENPKVADFLDKFTKQTLLQEKVHTDIITKLQEKVDAGKFKQEVLDKIEENREKHLEKFGEVMLKLEESKEKIAERVESALDKVKGSEFKDLKNLEILKKIEEQVPEKAKEAIKEVRENTLLKLENRLQELNTEGQEKLQDYIEKIKIEAENKLEILEDIRTEVKETVPQIKQKLENSRERVLEQIRVRTEEKEDIVCPQLMLPHPDACKNGRWIYEKTEDGCPSPRCIELDEEKTIEPESTKPEDSSGLAPQPRIQIKDIEIQAEPVR